MPIYAYKCSSCGHARDVLQKVSEAPLTVCPACGAQTFAKQVTAAGFQLKGSGWYVTDFRNGGKGGKTETADGKTDAKADGTESKTESKAEGKSEGSQESGSTEKSAPSTDSKSTAAGNGTAAS